MPNGLKLMMHKKVLKHLFLLCLVGAQLATAINAQQPCQPPAPLTQSQDLNIFTQKQEVDLGDAIAEQLQRNFRVIDDPEIADYLKRIGERITRHLPPNELKFQFLLVELPEANAFVLPGGRIYVSRKMIAFAQSEDELAGVIAHETGHLIARQQAIEMTRLMREVLGVTKVTDRRDIFEKYNQLVENSARKPDALGKGERHEDKDQIVADQIGLFALASAGYDPQSHARLFDRYAETKGKTGNFFSDLFGTTKPEAKRLREMIKGTAALPASCIDVRKSGAADEFQKWQAMVVNYTGTGKRESLHAVLSKTVLEPPLRSEINHLRFSPDGKYVLAQDDSGINVLSREPFALLFRIRALEANDAQFTPDSQNIVFYNTDLRVEIWNVAEQKLKSAREMVMRKHCLQTLLSPDGKTMACLDGELSLNLYDVESGAQTFQKKSFYTPNLFDLIFLRLRMAMQEEDSSDDEVNWIKMGFSTDGKYFVAGQKSMSVNMLATTATISTENAVVAVDTQTRANLSLKGSVKKLIAGGFTFLGTDRLAAYNQESPQKSAIIALPSGETVEQTPMFEGAMSAATRGNYVFVRPFQKYAVGVYDLSKKQIFKVNKFTAIDIYDQVFVAERISGELVLYGVEKNDALAGVTLPRNPFGKLRAVTVSQDFKWLAASERARGAVWDATKGERIFHIRGFRGGYFAADGNFFADFPKIESMERQLGRLSPDDRQAFNGPELKDDAYTRQFGAFTLLTTAAKKYEGLDKDVVLEMRQTQSFKTLWSKPFTKEAPTVWVNPRDESMILIWAVLSKHAQSEIKNDAALSKQLAGMKEKEGDYYLQILDARTGEARGRLLVETGKGSFRIKSASATGDWVVITDNENRVLVYALSSGEQKGKVFGSRAALSKASNLLCVENENGQVTIYDVMTMEKRDQFIFSSPMSLASFSQDGKKLFVLTADQTAYVLDLSALVK
jgi:WD40 repeat protein